MGEARTVPPQLRLRELFDFDAIAGKLIWRVRPAEEFATANSWNNRLAGTVAGWVGGKGYREISVDGQKCKAHRLIWTYANGLIPDGKQIDHINGNRDDNRIENLRLVTIAENNRNSSVRIDSKSGVAGVVWHGYGRKWQASIKIGGRKRHLGLFETLEAAIAARAKACLDFGYHPGHGKPMRRNRSEVEAHE